MLTVKWRSVGEHKSTLRLLAYCQCQNLFGFWYKEPATVQVLFLHLGWGGSSIEVILAICQIIKGNCWFLLFVEGTERVNNHLALEELNTMILDSTQTCTG